MVWSSKLFIWKKKKVPDRGVESAPTMVINMRSKNKIYETQKYLTIRWDTLKFLAIFHFFSSLNSHLKSL